MHYKGTISSWNDEKGFGFISPIAGGARIFVHIKAFGGRHRRPALNDVVTFSVGKDSQGRARALSVAISGDSTSRPRLRSGTASAVIVGSVFLAVLAMLVFTTRLPPLILHAYVIISAVTFLTYAFDKRSARRGGWRISEKTLHALALAGGWPGALVARQVLRHKSRKQPFRFVFWITVIANCCGLAWLQSAAGRTILTQFS